MGGEEGEERESPLIPSVSDPAEGPFKRTGKLKTQLFFSSGFAEACFPLAVFLG